LIAGLALLAGLLAIATPAWSADEDTSSSVYLVFDPETGEFKTEHDPNMTQAEQATQEAIESVADVPADAALSDSAVGGSDKTTAGASWLTLAVVIGLIALVVLFALLRNRK
jgi:hypothetical protein